MPYPSIIITIFVQHFRIIIRSIFLICSSPTAHGKNKIVQFLFETRTMRNYEKLNVDQWEKNINLGLLILSIATLTPPDNYSFFSPGYPKTI